MTPKRICGTCRHFKPQRNPETGRAYRRRYGECGWEFPWPERMPMVYEVCRKPHPTAAWYHFDATACTCWQPAETIRETQL